MPKKQHIFLGDFLKKKHDDILEEEILEEESDTIRSNFEFCDTTSSCTKEGSEIENKVSIISSANTSLRLIWENKTEYNMGIANELYFEAL